MTDRKRPSLSRRTLLRTGALSLTAASAGCVSIGPGAVSGRSPSGLRYNQLTFERTLTDRWRDPRREVYVELFRSVRGAVRCLAGDDGSADPRDAVVLARETNFDRAVLLHVVTVGSTTASDDLAVVDLAVADGVLRGVVDIVDRQGHRSGGDAETPASHLVRVYTGPNPPSTAVLGVRGWDRTVRSVSPPCDDTVD